MSKAITITASGVMDYIDFDESKSYETIRQAVDGMIQCINIPSLDVDMWINDEGKLVNDPQFNAFGTALWTSEYGMTDIIMGDIIITGSPDDEGYTKGLDSKKALEVIQVVQDELTKTLLKQEA